MDCPSCGHPNPSFAKFCNECGTRFPSNRAQQARAERRQLTVVFCDLVGSTALSEVLDPEDFASLIEAFQDTCRHSVGSWGGYVAKTFGDGLLLYFGYPHALEDAPSRAIRAGLELTSAVPRRSRALEDTYAVLKEHPLAARTGIHTGLVVVGEVATAGTDEKVVLGGVPNIAARLQEHAEANQVVISDATRRLVPGMFVTRDLGRPPLKGVNTPLHAHAVLQPTGVRSRLDVDRPALTPLIGRGPELAQLRGAWQQTKRGNGQAVLVTGEPGVGKSRLVRAFRDSLIGADHSWIECRGSERTQTSPFHPIVELGEQGLGFQKGDTTETRFQRLEDAVNFAGLPPHEVVPFVAPLFSLPVPSRYPTPPKSPALRRKTTIAALVAWFVQIAEQQPLAIFFDDLHWCDPSTVELLDALLARVTAAKLLILLAFRTDFESPWAAGESTSRIDLGRLSHSQALAFISTIQPARPLSDEATMHVVERADGIPLFLEELSKMAAESSHLFDGAESDNERNSVGPDAIPATLQDSLMARLDRLEAGKEVAQLSAVIGREFSYGLLQSVWRSDASTLDRGLQQLVDAELLFETGPRPESSFRFKHALVHDAAYQSVLKRTVQELHQRVARVLEESFPETGALHPELLAHHFAEAGAARRAVLYLQKGGLRALERFANQEAVGHLNKALALLGELPESPDRDRQELEIRIPLGIGLMLSKGYAWPDVGEVFQRARELSERLEDESSLFRALAGLYTWHQVRADYEVSGPLADQLFEAAKRHNDPAMIVDACYAKGIAAFATGDPSARDYFEQGISHFESHAQPSHAFLFGHAAAITCFTFAGMTNWMLGYLDRGVSRYFEGVAAAERLAHPVTTALVLLLTPALKWSEFRESAERVFEIASEHALPIHLASARILLGFCGVMGGQGESAIAPIEQGLKEYQATGAESMMTIQLYRFAEAYCELGKPDEGLEVIAQAIAQVERTNERFLEAEIYLLKAKLHLLSDARREAEACLFQSIEVSQRQRAMTYELRASTALAHLWQRQGKPDQARALLSPIYDRFREGFDTVEMKEAKALIDELE